MLITLTTGSEKRGGEGECKFFVFALNPGPTISELFLNSKIEGVKRVGGAERHPAVAGRSAEHGGAWNRVTFMVPDGMCLKVFASRRGGFMGERTAGCMYVVARETAPLVRISAPTLRQPTSTLTEAFIEGRFDILSLEQATSAGLVNEAFAHFGMEAAIAATFSVKEIGEGMAAPVREVRMLETEAGETVSVETVRKPRVMDL